MTAAEELNIRNTVFQLENQIEEQAEQLIELRREYLSRKTNFDNHCHQIAYQTQYSIDEYESIYDELENRINDLHDEIIALDKSFQRKKISTYIFKIRSGLTF